MNKLKTPVYRLCLDINQISILHSLILKLRNENYSLIEEKKSLFNKIELILAKELLKADYSSGQSYNRISDENKIKPRSIDIFDLGFSSEDLINSNNKKLSEHEKISLMTEEEQNKFWELEMNKITKDIN